ncbi:unnamed protein product, partial [Tetraodon nigroviridis]
DVCNSTDLPEFEIISLLEEQLPVYRLRADTVYGYDQDDWLHTPLVAPDARLELTTEQIDESLKYFLLCADRVGQMTKTYNDIDAVTRLLEEVGRSVVTRSISNRVLYSSPSSLSVLRTEREGSGTGGQDRAVAPEEEQNSDGTERLPGGARGADHRGGALAATTLSTDAGLSCYGNRAVLSQVAQLHHELNLKDELLQFYTSVTEESEDESSGSPTLASILSLWCFPFHTQRLIVRVFARRARAVKGEASGAFVSEVLQRKLKDLEEENLLLRSEANHLKSETETYEEKEQQLVNDCVKELRLSSLQISAIAEELARKTEDASRQQEEITHLLSQIVDLQKKAKSYAVENEELSQHLVAAKDAQRQLTAELQELEEKYSECIEMLHEAQEELKNLRNRNYPAGTPRRYHPLGLYPMDSLAAEIEGTMRKELSLDDPECKEQKSHRKRVFETVKTVNQTVRRRSVTPTSSNIPGSNQSLSSRTSPQSSGLSSPHSSNYGGDVSGDGVALDNRVQSILMESNQDSGTDGREKKASGAEDLRLALRRLSLRRQNNLSERRFFEEERDRRQGGHGALGVALEHQSAMTPSESIMSLGNIHVWASRGPYLPDKLQIVKPLEAPPPCTTGSSWPSLTWASSWTPGQASCRRATGPWSWSWSSLNPVPASSSCVMTSSVLGTPAATPCTPRRLGSGRQNATRTTSTSLGLVRLLQERGISAAVYHQSQAPEYSQGNGGVLFSTSVAPNQVPSPGPLRPSTPPNSPTEQGASSGPTPAGFDFKSPSYDNFLASKPARSILKEVAGRMRGRQRGRDCESQTDVSVTVHNLNLVDKVKRLGVAGASGGRAVSPSPILGPLGGLRRSGSPFGPDGMRRNRSYPAVVGASMAMKAPG